MKDQIAKLIETGLEHLVKEGLFSGDEIPELKIDRTRDEKHGDFSVNVAMVLAKSAGVPPRDLAQKIVDSLPVSPIINKIEIAGPGFINFFLNETAQHSVIGEILEGGDTYGHSQAGKDRRILVEFVSANPTGPLHVGHGRGAAFGATLANLLESRGYQVDREYYVNDAGRQMDILAVSIYIRYLQKCNVSYPLPDQCYQGEYINEIAAGLFNEQGESLVRELAPPVKENDPELALDLLIEEIRSRLGEHYGQIHIRGMKIILGEIREDLEAFGVEFNNWYSEQSLQEGDRITQVIEHLAENGFIYENGGARWFKSQDLGDEKDRVVVRENGQATYFASDIAYHDEKYRRGYDRIIDIWGADHHGYIARVRAALKALGHDLEKLDILLVQFVSLYRGSEKVQMSTRSGQFVTLRQLREEVGRDATRFFYVMRKCEQPLDFDLELAKSSTRDNPVYYIQYAHARICRLLEKYTADNSSFSAGQTLEFIEELKEAREIQLIGKLSEYNEVLQSAADNFEPHLLVYYLKDLANEFHTYYDTHRVMGQPKPLEQARMGLCLAVKQIIANGLNLLGVSAPEMM
ncbi:MAG: arginine--tRNA ligase [Gammaproteobacteria bacterium]|nr:arginine--tRNA ligase [Gammaproteobacteria bacterium]